MMETMLEARSRLHSAGYDVDFSATEGSRLRCSACGTDHEPKTMVIDEVGRYEGASNPDDETILLALRCDCGHLGVYMTGYGPNAGTADTSVLVQLR